MQYSSDLNAYDDQIRALPRITPEEEASLLAQIRDAHEGYLPPDCATHAKRRLVEGYLGLVVFLVRQHRQTLKHLSPLDLIQEGNLALVQVVDAAHAFTHGTFSGYVAGAIRHALSKARLHDDAIVIPSSSAYALRQAGHLQDVDQLQPCSLDAPLWRDRHRVKDDQRKWQDLLVAPARCASEPPAPIAQQLAVLLPCLTMQQRQIITMRYGLDASPCYGSYREIARVLGVNPATVACVEQQAMRRLRRAMVEGVHPLMTLPTSPQASQRRLETAYEQCSQQGIPITVRLLTKTAHIPHTVVTHFIDAREGPPAERLTRAYAALIAEGKTPNALVLCQMAHVTIKAASAFLRTQSFPPPPKTVGRDKPVAQKASVIHEKREVRYARLHQEQQARLEAASDRLRAQGVPITATRLSQEVRVDRRAAQAFCRSHGPGEQERLAQALHTLQAQNESVTVAALCHLAGVSGKQASAFLRAKRGSDQERLSAALAHLEAQGMPVTVKRLAHTAQINRVAVSTFLRERNMLPSMIH